MVGGSTKSLRINIMSTEYAQVYKEMPFKWSQPRDLDERGHTHIYRGWLKFSQCKLCSSWLSLRYLGMCILFPCPRLPRSVYWIITQTTTGSNRMCMGSIPTLDQKSALKGLAFPPSEQLRKQGLSVVRWFGLGPTDGGWRRVAEPQSEHRCTLFQSLCSSSFC